MEKRKYRTEHDRQPQNYGGEKREITAAEWWDFAPWQDMKDAPTDGKFMARIKWISEKDGSVTHTFCMAWRSDVSKSGFMRNDLVPLYESFEWLPLPTRDL